MGFWKKAVKFGVKPLQGIQHGLEKATSILPGMNDKRAAALTKALGGGIGANGLPGMPQLPGMPGGAKIPGLPTLPTLPGMRKPGGESAGMPPPPGAQPIGELPGGDMNVQPMPGMQVEGAPIGDNTFSPVPPAPLGNKLDAGAQMPRLKPGGQYQGTAVSSAKGLAGGIPMRGGGRML